jgi:hypothetical protein
LFAEFEKAKRVCSKVALAAVTASTAYAPNSRKIGSVVAAGIEERVARSLEHAATAKSCMADRGYIYSKRSEFEARCP